MKPPIGGPASVKVGFFVLLGLVSVSVLPIHPVHAASPMIKGNFYGELLDPARPRLYLVGYSSNSLAVLNTTSHKIIANISVGPGPMGMAVSANGKELYVALSGNNALAILNLETLAVNRTIQLSATPFDVAAGRQGRAYLTTYEKYIEGWGYPLAVDTNNSREIGTITAAGQVFDGALARTSPNHDFLYVAEAGLTPSTVYRFFVGSDNVSLISGSPFNSVGDNLQDFAVSPDGSRLYVASGWPYYVQGLNTSNWASIGNLVIGPYPTAIGLDGPGGLALASNRTGLALFNTTTLQLLKSFSVNNAFEVKLSKDGSNAYILNGSLVILDTGFSDARPVPSEPHDTTPPSWPQGSYLSASNVNSTSLDLDWNPATDDLGVTSYSVYQNGTVIATVGSSSFNFHVTGLNPSTTYLFKVEAVDYSNNWSTDGPFTSVTTVAAQTSTATTSSEATSSRTTTSVTTTSSTTRASVQATSSVTTASPSTGTSQTTSSGPSTSGIAPTGQGFPIGELTIAAAIIVAGALIALAIRTRPKTS